ncbi:hypothetical protein HZA98_03860 [Candidatus Woesearchaeota archaeon]|nr:hypothetical protein [Candidatus Woesearchaeota archaeon]
MDENIITLEKKVDTFYQIKQGQVEDKPETRSYDLRLDPENKPFGANYFSLPQELPLDWQDCGETGTRGSIYQKDD